MVKFAFGQPTNHDSVGCGVNIYSLENNTVLQRPCASSPQLLKMETKYCFYNRFKASNMPWLIFAFW